jgi:hypothetical protein
MGATDVSGWKRRFEVPMLVVAALVIPWMLLEQPGVGQPWYDVGVALNWLVWLAFLIELVVMLAVTPASRDGQLDISIYFADRCAV